MLQVRGGIPHFARRVASGQPATIVAYGTSLTHGGQYLARVTETLATAAGNGNVRLVNAGLRGYMALWAAFRVGHDVLPHDPDLVLIEFAHNEATPDALAYCTRALDGIIAQIRRARPKCDIAFVYFAPHGAAAGGPTAGMRLHEEVADYYGLPSIDLTQCADDAVASGVALTVDGVHHAPVAADALGRPFAGALLELLRASTAAPQPAPAARDALFAHAWSAPASQFIAKGRWSVGPFDEREPPVVDAYVKDVAAAAEPGAMLRIPFRGAWVFAWALGNGGLTSAFPGRPERYPVVVDSGDRWRLLTLIPQVAAADYVLEVTVTGTPVVFGDIFVVGA